MHLVWMLRCLWRVVRLTHSQSIHVGKQSDAPATGVVALDCSNNAELPNLDFDVDFPIAQLLCSEIGSKRPLDAQLRIRVDAAPFGDDVINAL